MTLFDSCWNAVRMYLRGQRSRVTRRHIASVLSKRYTQRTVGRVLAAMRKGRWIRLCYSGSQDTRSVTYMWIGD